MLRPDLDKYYTPPLVARRVVEACEISTVDKCLDTTCGDGSLLSAARKILPGVLCVGMEVDRTTIVRLRKREPSWILSHADALSSTSWRQAIAGKHAIGCDLAVLNPPFTMLSPKGIALKLPEFSGRCSVAMAHILVALTKANPSTCVAIVPESLMYSDLDELARKHLEMRFGSNVVFGLSNSTFRGARVNAIVVRFQQRSRLRSIRSHVASFEPLSAVKIIRGGLPTFEAKSSRLGIRFLHTTDLKIVATDSTLKTLRKVKPVDRGIISGHVVLLPRVGMPKKENVRALYLREKVQLSDCVIALHFQTRTTSTKWEQALRRRWRSLLSLYRGTGARYTTLSRIRLLLKKLEHALNTPKTN